MNILEQTDQQLERKLADAMARLSVVMRADDWDVFGAKGLNPTQGQILMLLGRRQQGLRLSEIAEELAVTAATTSDSISTLVAKGLVTKEKSLVDRRAIEVRLSADGEVLVADAEKESGVLESALSVLSEKQKVGLFRTLTQLIRELQETGRLPMARMCVSCRYFRPHAHADTLRPHHCALVNSPLGEKTLRHDCPEHEAADQHLAAQNWRSFAAG